MLMFQLLGALVLGKSPWGVPLFIFVPRPSAPCRDEPLGFLSSYVSVSLHHVLVNTAELQKPHILPHRMENSLCKYAGLCKSSLGSCSSGSASLVPGAGICSLSPLWFSGQDLQLVNPYWALLAGSFPALCPWQPLQSSLKLGISLERWVWCKSLIPDFRSSCLYTKAISLQFFSVRLQCSISLLVSPNNQLFPLSCRLLSKTNLFDCEKLCLF